MYRGFFPEGTPSYKLYKYQRPKGRVFAQGRGGGVNSDFKWQGWANGAKNKNPKKSLGLPTKPSQKSLDQKLAPKKSHGESLSLNRRTRRPGFSVGTITILQILPNNQNNPYLNQATPKKFLPNFTTQKDLGIENFKPPKILWSSLSLEGRSTPPPPMGFVGAFWSENGYRLCLSGMVFEGTTVEYERICYFSSKWLIKKEIYANLKWILTKLFCCCPNLSNDDIFS